MSVRGRHPVRAALLLTSLLLSTVGCRRKHVKVSSVPELGYPQCEGKEVPLVGTVISSRAMRANADAIETDVMEQFRFEKRGCLRVGTTHQAWHISIADVEAVFDENLVPIRVWKRLITPGASGPTGNADIRRYEFRTPEITIKHRKSDGSMEYEILKGGMPKAIITPGHGLLSAWIQRANLDVGQKVRELVLDLREQVEVIREVTLRRDPDLYRAWAGGNVRVYTIYGRESVFTDQQNVVIGDLLGLQPEETVKTPAPPPMPEYDPPDPINTP